MILAVVTAVIYGSADFAGGLATKRARVVSVLLGAHAIGLVGVFVASLLLAQRFAIRDLALGGLAGVSGLIGLIFLYRRLAEGPMQVVAPLSAVTAAAVPALWGVVGGERLSALAWLGVGLAGAAIVMVSVSSERSSAPVTPTVIVESLLSGAGFGTLFILLDATDSATAPWPIVGGRVVTFALLAAFVLSRGEGLGRGRVLWGLIAAAGLGDTAANVTFLFALERGDLVVVSVLTSLYPVATVALARLVLGERMTSLQLAGFGAAMTATALIAAG